MTKTGVMLPIRPDSHFYNGGEKANCFPAAMRLALDLVTCPKLQPKICHGVVTCTDPDDPIKGQRILHGWVEIEDEGLHCVIDASMPELEPILMLREDYYELSRVNESAVQRYEILHAVQAAQYLSHCGPWEQALERVADGPLPDEMLLPKGWRWAEYEQ